MKQPLSITIIGITLIILGLYVGLVMIMEALQHRFFLNVAVLMIPIGIGLLRGRPTLVSWARGSVAFVGLCSAGIVLRFLAGPHHASESGVSLQFLGALLLFLLSPFAWRSLGKLKADSDLKAAA
jgi:hypothetical protein